jgi:CubicO group peptidase (beta-lactamase class C family)
MSKTTRMKSRWVGAVLCLLAGASSGRAELAEGGVQVPDALPAPLTQRDLAAWADGFLPFALQRGDVAGAVIVVVKDGAVLFSKGYGYADVASHAPVDPARTLFRPGSVSKLFTWTAVMQLVEQGKLDLDADINRYLDFTIPAAFGKPITLRHLMTHTAGFEEQGKGLFGTTADRDLSLEGYVKRWTPKRIFPPGDTPAYSNYGAALAGYIVSRVSGLSFDDFIESRIFAPLRMEHSSFRLTLPEKLRQDVSKGYAEASGPAKPYELVIGSPAGNLASSGEDMARFMLAHLQNGALGDSRILKEETARAMHTTASAGIAPLNRMMLGFYETNRNGHRVVGHGGDTQWFHSTLRLFIDDGVGLYISLNSAGRDASAEILQEALFSQFCDRYFPGPTLDGAVDAKLATEHGRMMARSRYELSRRNVSNFSSLIDMLGQTTVGADDDGTIRFGLTFAGQPRQWREISPFVWRATDVKILLAAQVVDGCIARFSLDYMSPFMEFQSVPWWRSSAWLLPTLIVSLALLVFASVAWPVSALVRRHYDVARAPQSNLPSYRLSRFSYVAVFVVLAAWVITLTVLSSDNGFASPRFDPLFWTLQLLSLIAFLGAAAAAIRHQWSSWPIQRSTLGRVYNLTLSLACVFLLWLAIEFRLINFSVNY